MRNVLFIIVDDLRPNLVTYGHPFMHTPNMDGLASSATIFTHAYVQYSLCMPSRNSLLLGRRPHRTRIFSGMYENFRDPFPEQSAGGRDWVTLPQFFRKHGYLTLGAGKVFGMAPHFDVADGDGNALSWDHFVWAGDDIGCPPLADHASSRPPDHRAWLQGRTEPLIVGKAGHAQILECQAAYDDHLMCGRGIDGRRIVWCALEDDSEKLSLSVDRVVVNATVSHLREAKQALEAVQPRPFFIAVGIKKPHLPFYFPASFFQLYPLTSISLPQQKTPPEHMPSAAWHSSCESKTHINVSVVNPPFQQIGEQVVDWRVRELRRAYYASISFADANIGVVLETLDILGLRESTLVALFGDNGFHLGENAFWRKMTNFELGVRVPLILRVPWKPVSAGMRSARIVEIVSIYRTLVDLVTLPAPLDDIDGESFADEFDKPGVRSAGSGLAFSQYAKESVIHAGVKHPWGVCFDCNMSDIVTMGFSVRDERWRYTEWRVWDQTLLLPRWDLNPIGVELYDHIDDDGSDFDASAPAANLANASYYSLTRRRLGAALAQMFNHPPPLPPSPPPPPSPSPPPPSPPPPPPPPIWNGSWLV